MEAENGGGVIAMKSLVSHVNRKGGLVKSRLQGGRALAYFFLSRTGLRPFKHSRLGRPRLQKPVRDLVSEDGIT